MKLQMLRGDFDALQICNFLFFPLCLSTYHKWRYGLLCFKDNGFSQVHFPKL